MRSLYDVICRTWITKNTSIKDEDDYRALVYVNWASVHGYIKT